MNGNEFAFIICVNNEEYFQECRYYIEQLEIPKGYEIDVMAIRDADSMCAAYNLGMQSTEAKYKIYMHQDVFIRNKCFLQELLRLFQKPETGMVGMMGGTKMPKNGVAYLSWDITCLDCRDTDAAYILSGDPEISQDTQVEAVDGLLIATQYDIRWREDLFQGFDFYDISASFEMRKAGYQVVVPYMREPWVIHDSSFVKLSGYDRDRQICIKEYDSFFHAENGLKFEYKEEWELLVFQLTEQLKQLLSAGEWGQVRATIEEYRKGGKKNSNLEMIGIMTDIWEAEQRKGITVSFFKSGFSWKEIYEKYIKVRFLLRRVELGMPEKDYRELIEAFVRKEISVEALIIFILHSIIDKKLVLEVLEQYALDYAMTEEAMRLQEILKVAGMGKTPLVYTKMVNDRKEP